MFHIVKISLQLCLLDYNTTPCIIILLRGEKTMYILTVEDYISAAHQLIGYKGRCENIHGHNWKIEISVCGEKLNDIGIMIDFHDLKAMIKEVLDEFDHKNLNDVDVFKSLNPSSEHLSRIIYENMSIKLGQYSKDNNTEIKLLSIVVWESATCRSAYQNNFLNST